MISPGSMLGALLVAMTVTLVLPPAAAHATSLPTVTARPVDDRATEDAVGDVGVVEIVRTGPVDDPLDVNYTTIYSSADRGRDYRHPAEGTPNGWRAVTAIATIPAGEPSVTLRFVATNDRDPELTEQIVVTISHKERSYRIGEEDEAVISMVDDERPVAPNPPSDLLATRVSARRVNLAWVDQSTNETGFEIQQRSAGSAEYEPIAMLESQHRSFTTSLPRGATATYRVVARNDVGTSAPSNESTPDAQPSLRRSWLQHVTVAKEKGRSNGWPANGGMWNWGNEIVVMYDSYHFRRSPNMHAIAFHRPQIVGQARSVDGGRTWKVEKNPIVRPGPPGFPTDGTYGPEPKDLKEPIDFANPDLALHVRMVNKDYGGSYLYYSYDRAKTWRGPFRLPNFDLPTVNARTDYVIDGKREIRLFLSGTEDTNFETRTRPFVVRSADGGLSWDFLSYVNGEGVIQPSTVRISPTSLVSATRTLRGIEVMRSDDNGGSWDHISSVTEGFSSAVTNPGSLTRLEDGRIVMSYGYRSPPFGVRARISDDNGATWSDPVILRQDAPSGDVGYSQDVLRPDGKIVTTYYMNSGAFSVRTVDATIWDPDAAFAEGSDQGRSPAT